MSGALGAPRRAHASDAPAIADWFSDRAAVVLWTATDAPDPLTADWVAGLFGAANGRRYFVCENDRGEPTAVFALAPFGAERRVHLLQVALSDRLRGRGHAGELMQIVLSVARAEAPEAERITLNVFGSNTPALRAYQRAGFVAYERVETKEDPSGFLLRMERPLGWSQSRKSEGQRQPR